MGVQKATSRPIDAHLEVWFKTLIKKMAGNKKREEMSQGGGELP